MNEPLTYSVMDSPLGPLTLIRSPKGLKAIRFPDEPGPPKGATITDSDPAQDQLREYFAGKRQTFDLVIDMGGTAFQREVWTALMDIPYGQTRCYSELASTLGRPKSSRAVGAANGKNPIPVVVPCHRVVGKNGTLTGYAGGLALKEVLLNLEGVTGLKR